MDRHADRSSDTRVDNMKIKSRAAIVSSTAEPAPPPPAPAAAAAPLPGTGALSGRGVLVSMAGRAGRDDRAPWWRRRGADDVREGAGNDRRATATAAATDAVTTALVARSSEPVRAAG